MTCSSSRPWRATHNTVLVIGAGAREHALAWKLLQGTRTERVIVAPGNGGTALMPRCSNAKIAVDDIQGLCALVQSEPIDAVLIGPEVALVAGLADALENIGVPCFGPKQAPAQLEGSKAYAKHFMQDAGIPTAAFAEFTELLPALEFVRSRPFDAQKGGCVVKADGLAAGKGVAVCATLAEAEAALQQQLGERIYGPACDRVVIEALLPGVELSVLAWCDGQSVHIMPPVRDHKRLRDQDLGPNTGGMGAFSPVPGVDAALLQQVDDAVFQPFLRELARRGLSYCGVIYAGLMLHEGRIQVLEFNCRFGDPETQVLMPLLNSDLVDVMQACCTGTLTAQPPEWSDEAGLTVVMAAPGYPEAAQTGAVVQLPDAPGPARTALFHAGTRLEQDTLRTAGGRVLALTAWGKDLASCRTAVYALVAQTRFEGAQWRSDIAHSVLHQEAGLCTGPHQQRKHLTKLIFSEPDTDMSTHSSLSAYASAGVDIAEGDRAVRLMQDAVQATYTPAVLAGIGAFGGMIDVSALKAMQAPVLVASTDGVGTKTMVAQALNRWDSIGEDLVNHSVNDILVQGGEPLFFMDYVATAKLEAQRVATIVAGMARGCKNAGCVLLGGETAEMPGVYHAGHWDVAGTIVGVVERAAVLDGSRMADGDVLLALPSSGLHTNGYSLARKLLEGLDWSVPVAQLAATGQLSLPELRSPRQQAEARKSLGDLLLAVHVSYLQPYRALRAAGVDLHGMVHITGGGLQENIPRVLPATLSAHIHWRAWPVPLIFDILVARGGLPLAEQQQVLNMGVGMVVAVATADLSKVEQALGADHFSRIGHIAGRSAGDAAVVIQPH